MTKQLINKKQCSILIYANQMKTFRELIVWQKAMLLVTSTYETTLRFPLHEQFGLTSQLRRCAVSIPSNIAKGFARNTNKD